MTKKLFAVLLLIPMLVFIGDQVMGNTGPEGGKDKKKKKQKTEAKANRAPEHALEKADVQTPDQAQATDENQAVYHEAEVAFSNSSTDRGITHKNAEKFRILKNYFTNLDNQFMEYDENSLSPHGRGMDEKISNFLNKELLEVVKKIDPSNVESSEWFSRCPSGYFYVIDGDAHHKPLATGNIGQKRGCSRVNLGDFRYHVEAGVVEMRLPGKLGYVSIEKYFQVRKSIMG